MNEIVYINFAKAECLPGKPQTIENVVVTRAPTKCKVTINGNIVINDVYVYHHDSVSSICLFREYKIELHGIYSGMRTRLTPYFSGEQLVIEFKSDNYIIEKYE